MWLFNCSRTVKCSSQIGSPKQTADGVRTDRPGLTVSRVRPSGDALDKRNTAECSENAIWGSRSTAGARETSDFWTSVRERTVIASNWFYSYWTVAGIEHLVSVPNSCCYLPDCDWRYVILQAAFQIIDDIVCNLDDIYNLLPVNMCLLYDLRWA